VENEVENEEKPQPEVTREGRRTWLQRKLDGMTPSEIVKWLDTNHYGEPLPAIRIITRQRPYKKPLMDDPSPSFENAVRTMEDYCE